MNIDAVMNQKKICDFSLWKFEIWKINIIEFVFYLETDQIEQHLNCKYLNSTSIRTLQ